MAEPNTLETLSPKELGKHLREVRRRKGLSLSEVARGAGLTRRELNAYEKGKSVIPDSDLFVLAGSCGVDVAELRVPTTAAELSAAHEVGNALVPANGPQPVASTIGDVVAQLRRTQEVAPPPDPDPVPAPSRRRRRARALEAAAPEPVAEVAPASWPDQVDSYEAVRWPDDASIPSPSASATRAPAEPVDVFQELARLPDPEPLPVRNEAGHDFFGRLPDPEPPLTLTDEVADVAEAPTFAEWPAFETDNDEATFDQPTFAESAIDESGGEPVLVEMPLDALPDLTSAADAPPINVEMRGEAVISPWDALRGSDALSTVEESESAYQTDDDWRYPSPSHAASETVDDTDIWEPATVAAGANTQWFDEVSSVATPDTDPGAFEMHVDDEWIVDAPDVVDRFDEPGDGAFLASDPAEVVDAAPEASVSHIFDPRFAGAPEAAPGSWAHEPDPNATSTGFYIDWGESDDNDADAIGTAASVWDLPEAGETETAAATIAAPWTLDAESQVVESEAGTGTHPVYQAPYDDDADEADAAPAFDALAPVADPLDVFVPYQHEPYEPESTEAVAPEPDLEPAPLEAFVPYQHEPYEPEPTDAFASPEPEPQPEPLEAWVPYQHEPYEPEPSEAVAAPEPDLEPEPLAAFVPYQHEPYEPEPTDSFVATEPEPLAAFVPYQDEPYEPEPTEAVAAEPETVERAPLAAFVPYQHEPYEPEPSEAAPAPAPEPDLEPAPLAAFVPYQHERYEPESTETFESLEPEAVESPEAWVPYQHEPYAPEPSEAVASPEPFESFAPAAPAEPFELEPAESDFIIEGDDEPPVISWHPQLDNALGTPIEPLAPVAEQVLGALIRNEPTFVVHTPEPDPEPEPEPEPERTPEPAPRESFVVAGPEWILGNAVPLVEVRNTGSLVMRRVDERWAIADLIASSNFAVEVTVDLRSGPGFGVLFCADLDDEGRMSGYSFDFDPVYEGGGYLVREWRANRELWNPIGHVAAPHLADMHGLLEVRVTVEDDRFVAAVNGEVVLTIDSLHQAAIDRGRAGAAGNLVGVQAWSSTDLVIDELRLANH